MKYAKNSKERPALGFGQKIRRGTQLTAFGVLVYLAHR